MKSKIGFRFWFYFRTGWMTYFAFIFSAINTLVVTYYLAIERVPFLIEIFPSFAHYVGVATIIGIPLLAAVGYTHYKRMPAYSSEVDIGIERNPYVFKLQPGWNQKVVFPMYRLLTIMLLKLSNNEKLNEDEVNEIKKVLADIENLSQGGWINKPKGMV
uniref:Uncharacterized protein n=1 Tax=uncultured marine thaumarchaeote KM3_60_F11 TaxID=1456212 RepID=A0A075HB77_9ARCH|nr:hypothetical protein [uncultured marine thaumarchaeote KM3_60_F11]